MTSFRPWPSLLTTSQQRMFPAQSLSMSNPSPTLFATSDREYLLPRNIKINATSVETPDTPVLTQLKTDRSLAQLSGRFVQSVETLTTSCQSASQVALTPDRSLRLLPTSTMRRIFAPPQPRVPTAVMPLSPLRLRTSLPSWRTLELKVPSPPFPSLTTSMTRSEGGPRVRLQRNQLSP